MVTLVISHVLVTNTIGFGGQKYILWFMIIKNMSLVKPKLKSNQL